MRRRVLEPVVSWGLLVLFLSLLAGCSAMQTPVAEEAAAMQGYNAAGSVTAGQYTCVDCENQHRNYHTDAGEPGVSFSPDGQGRKYSQDFAGDRQYAVRGDQQYAVSRGIKTSGAGVDGAAARYVVTERVPADPCARPDIPEGVRIARQTGSQPLAVVPPQTAVVKGRVTEPSGDPVAVAIQWRDLATGKQAGVIFNNEQTGEYEISLPVETLYDYLVKKTGYRKASKMVDLVAVAPGQEMLEDILLYPLVVKTPEPAPEIRPRTVITIMNDILFDYDKAVIRPEAFSELNRIVNILKNRPELHLEIHGHADSRGSKKYNLQLSEKRAVAVYTYLQAKGISASRLAARGFGEDNPVAPNDTDEGRQQNRRVEFRF